MSKDKYGVHIAHCCYIHGCKYGDEDCPVASGEVAQKHLCWDCSEEYEPYTLEEIEMLRETKSYRPSYKQLKEKVADLEAKLAESEKKIEELKGERLKFYTDDVRRTQVINGVHFDIEQLLVFSEYVKHEKWVISIRDKEISELKHQLAEKDEKIEKLKSENHALMSDNAYQEADIFELNSFKEYYKNNKISFAVEKLEEVKEKLIQNEDCYMISLGTIKNIIDNQIKQLKEMN